MINDESRAYFYAPSESPTFVQICKEDYQSGDEEMCGELRMSMYGTRDAAQNWEEAYSEFMTEIGFCRGRASPCIFWHHVAVHNYMCTSQEEFA